MIQANENIINMIDSPSRKINARVERYEGSTLLQIFKYSDALKSVNVDRVGVKGKFFGFGVSHKLTVVLVDKDRSINITDKNTLELEFGAEADYIYTFPYFKVTEVKRDENTNELTITAYDALNEAAAHTVAELDLPTSYTIKDFAIKCAKLLGLSLNIENVTDDSFNLLFENGANFEGTENVREALDRVAEATQTIYFINSQWQLTFKRLDKDGSAVLTVDKSKYFTLESKTDKTLATICHATELGDNVSATKTKTGKNKFNNDFSLLKEFTYTGASGAKVTRIGYEIRLPAGTYTLTGDKTVSGDFIYVLKKDKNGKVIMGDMKDSFCGDYVKKDAYFLADTVNYSPINIKVNNGEVICIYDAISTHNLDYVKNLFSQVNIQIEEGEKATEFEPYYEQPITSTAHIIRGKNLLNNDGSLLKEITYTGGNGAKVTRIGYEIRLPAGTYTLSYIDKALKGDEYIYTNVNDKEGNYVSGAMADKVYTNFNKPDFYFIAATHCVAPIKYKINDGDVIYLFNANSSNSLELTKEIFKRIDLQLEEGEIATEYEPFYEYEQPIECTTQYVRNNPFWDMREDIADIVNNAVDAIAGITANQFNCEARGNFLLEVGDKLDFVTKDDNTVTSYLLNDTISYNGGLKQSMSWEDEENNSETPSNPATLGESLKQTFARVDKANKQIELLVSETEAQNEKISKIEMNTEGINASVGIINSEVEKLSKKVDVAVTAEDVTIAIQNEMQEGTAKVTTNTGFTFDDEGLTITKSGSEISTQITEDGMKVSRDNTEVLIADNKGVMAIDLHATTYLKIGKNSRIEDFEGNRSGCFWIGE